MKTLLGTLSVFVFLMVGVVFVQLPQQAIACGQDNTQRLLHVPGAPANTGIPPWHHYLECDATGGVANDIELNDIWLIGAAIGEMILNVAGVISLGYVIFGGFKYLTSQGSPDSTASARKTIIYGLVGLVVTTFASFAVSLTMNVIGAGQGTTGRFGLPNPNQTGAVENILNFVYALAGALAALYVVIGGIKFATSAGDPQKAASARNTIIYALVGVVVVLVAYMLTGAVVGRL